MVNLNTQSVVTNFNAPMMPMNNGGIQVTIPQSTVMLAKPLSYEFRVVEHVKNGEIIKVGLQCQIWEHDNYGSGNVKQSWTDVVRVQKDVDTGVITGV